MNLVNWLLDRFLKVRPSTIHAQKIGSYRPTPITPDTLEDRLSRAYDRARAKLKV
jgi:hypothetical protein